MHLNDSFTKFVLHIFQAYFLLNKSPDDKKPPAKNEKPVESTSRSLDFTAVAADTKTKTNGEAAKSAVDEKKEPEQTTISKFPEETSSTSESAVPKTPERASTEKPMDSPTPKTELASDDEGNALTDDEGATTDDEAVANIAKLARLHAHHKKKPNHSPVKGSAAAAALKELQASKTKNKKKKKRTT